MSDFRSPPHTTIEYFVRDNAGSLISMVTASTTAPAVSSNSTEDFYLTDGSDNVIGLTRPAGSLVASYSYDPYGGHMTATGTDAVANAYRFASAYLDPTGLYKMGARYYNPATGSFTQQDDATHTGDLSQGDRYAYAGDDPVNDLDPTGYFSIGDAFKIAGAVVGIGALALSGAGLPVVIGAGVLAGGLDATGGALSGDSAGSIAASATLDAAGGGIGAVGKAIDATKTFSALAGAPYAGGSALASGCSLSFTDCSGQG